MRERRPFREGPKIRVEHLCLERGGRRLIDNMSFEAKPGAFVEIRGANGAGKTTLLRAIAGFVRPSAGAVFVDDVEDSALALHYVGHLNGIKGAASVRAHVRYWAGLFCVADGEERAIAGVGLTREADLPARLLSQGQARRLALARLMVSRRQIWLLDEPAAALDAAGRAMLGALIASHCADGGIALAAVHDGLGPTPEFTLTVGA